MKKILTVIVALVALGLATVAAPQPAQARHGWVAGGILGGLAAGALIGAAAGPYYYGPGPYYYGPGPAYYAPGPCYWTRQRVWTGYGWRWHRVRFCR